MQSIHVFYLIVGSHLLACLKGVEVPLASSNIIVIGLKAFGEGLGIGLTGSSTGLLLLEDLLRWLLVLLLLLLGLMLFLRTTSTEHG
jgi:hypothetical protein